MLLPAMVKLTVYLPYSTLKSIQLSAAAAGCMRYSGFAEGVLSNVFSRFMPYKDFKELAENTTMIPADFVNSKAGRPAAAHAVPKKKVTFYFSAKMVQQIRKYSRAYSLSKTSLLELAFRIAGY